MLYLEYHDLGKETVSMCAKNSVIIVTAVLSRMSLHKNKHVHTQTTTQPYMYESNEEESLSYAHTYTNHHTAIP